MAERARNGSIVLVAGAAVTLVPFEDPRPQPRQGCRVLHTHPWQRRTETPEERQALLRVEAERQATRVEAHLESTDPVERQTLLVAAAPPGIGKSHSIAALGVPTTAHPLGEHAPLLDRRATQHGGEYSSALDLSRDPALHCEELLGR